MKALATVIVAISTIMMLAIVVGATTWVGASLASDSLGRSLFVGLVTIAALIPSAWLGVHIGNRLNKQNREYAQRFKDKRKP